MLATEQDTKVAGAIGGAAPELDDPTFERPLLDRIANHATVARIEIDLYEEAGKQHAALCGLEMGLEAKRAVAKQNAVLRLLQTPNPASGDAQKPYSATAADSAASLDPEYRAYLRRQAEVVVEKNLTRTKAESARLRAQLAVAMLKSESGVM